MNIPTVFQIATRRKRPRRRECTLGVHDRCQGRLQQSCNLKDEGYMKVVIIIPTYNEALIIEETLHQVFAITLPPIYTLHVLVFDSASKDHTAAQVLALQNIYPTLHLLQENKKTGLGSAYQQAMRHALYVLQADIIFEFDADLSHPPHYIPAMLSQLKDHDCVLGSRYIPGGAIPQQWTFYRKCLSIWGNRIARCILTPRYKDFTSGFRATKAATLKAILPQTFMSAHYAYKLHLLWLLHQHQTRILEIPIVFVDRITGKSKLPRNSILDTLRVILMLRFQSCLRYFKMCLVGTIGTLIQLSTYNVLRFVLSPFYATQFTTLLAIMHNFILNHHFTFKERSRHKTWRRFSLFLIYASLMITFQSYWVAYWTMILGETITKENMILLIGIGLGSILNYFVYNRFIWPKIELAS